MSLLKSKQLTRNEGYYFPLYNTNGLRASITPFFDGDLKLSHHQYALMPVSEMDLFTHRYSRNVVFKLDGVTYYLNGQTEHQQRDEVFYSTGLLYQRVLRKNPLFELDVWSYVAKDANLELHRVSLKNTKAQAILCDIHTAIPIYGRSADHLRDHRHVTSLLNQIEVHPGIISVKPTLSFDERGHRINKTRYSVGVYSNDLTVKHHVPILDDYIDGGSLDFPKGLHRHYPIGSKLNGYEAIGAICFEPFWLQPGDTLTFLVMIGIHEEESTFMADFVKYQSLDQFEKGLKEVQHDFQTYVSGLSFQWVNPDVSKQLSWVTLQPLLRRVYGNSFLPHHDYGRGGKGWRDLWQDLLALIFHHDAEVKTLLLNNFAGVRLDGSNATIIGDKPGEFKADRNSITRVWSDHGAWPFLTTQMYVNETGDFDFLLLKQSYFMDHFTHYTRQTRKPNQIVTYQGTVLEHLLIQNLVGFHRVGEHGFLRLEDADWNDGLDMANRRGESVAFTHFYAANLLQLSYLVQQLNQDQLELLSPIELLLTPNADLTPYFDCVANFDGTTQKFSSSQIAQVLKTMANEKIEFLRERAFDGERYLSYYDNQGQSIDRHATANLTGQAIALLSQVPTPSQALTMAKHTKKYLFAPHLGGYRLNTDYQTVLMDMGRAFGFAYGHKENGAVFSHMVMMYAYGLYQYNLVLEGREAVMTLLNQSMNDSSEVWVGIPEYFNDRGKGKYSYLTGSASWLLKLLRDQVFGIHMSQGKLNLFPKLMRNDFIKHQASITTYIFNRLVTLTYHNPKNLEYGTYRIQKVLIKQHEHALPLSQTEGDIEVYLDEIV